MGTRKADKSDEQVRRIPKVRIARPAGRPYQIRYTDPATGKEVRLTCGCSDESVAQRMKAETEARLLLGIDARHAASHVTGPSMRWEDFRDQYSTLQLATLRDGSATDAESRLDIAERILKPRTLGDMADQNALHRLRAALLAGVESRRGKPRSPYTAKGYMAAVLASLNWAHLQGWLPAVPKVQKIEVAKLKAMKGRPLVLEEFERMLDKTARVVGESAAGSWRHVLCGLWSSGLRLDELMHVSWDLPNTIRPEWRRGRLPVLKIPAEMQKNATEEEIPLLPWFEDLLSETPGPQRTGWIFYPASLQVRLGRKPRHGRPDAEWVGKIISRIGKAAGIIVDHGDERTGKPVKYASAHDLRRSCAERLLDSGVPPLVICRVLRHASWETTRKHYAPGDVQKDAGVLQERTGRLRPKAETATKELENVPGYIFQLDLT